MLICAFCSLNVNEATCNSGTVNGSGMDALTQAYSGMQQYAAGFPTFTQPNVQQQIQNASGKQSEGNKQKTTTMM